MLKKIFALCAAVMMLFGASAQTPLPLDPQVRTGKLPNGLTYFVQKNEVPKDRANFYIAQRVGSSLENPDQLGLAHFLEHMAFNGTGHFPGKAMLNYLQSKGIRFGADINAMTGFDETIYNINNVPTTDAPLVDSVLLALRDWSCDIALLDDEIEAERGVIQEEWRGSQNVSYRMIMGLLPKAFKEYQYQQTPIGKMEVVMHFKPEVLREYYKKWYRPDLQGIIVVGDFDPVEMEKKVIATFSDIPTPVNPAERIYPTISDNEKPIYYAFQDPEQQIALAQIMFKSDKTPMAQRNTVESYVADDVLPDIIASVINMRLAEYGQKPECAYAQASVGFGPYIVAKTKDAFNVVVVAKTDIEKAIEEAMAIVARACKSGITESELDRAKQNLQSSMDKRYNERDKRQSGAVAQGLIQHFIGNDPVPGLEVENMLMKQLLPNIPLQAINMAMKEILTPTNEVILVAQPEKEGSKLPEEQVVVDLIGNAINAEYEAYVDEKITEPLLAVEPTPGKIVSIKENKEIDGSELMLSNGVKVLIKATDFAADEVRLMAVRKGGKNLFKESDAPNVLLFDDAVSSFKVGNFDKATLRKYLAGKYLNTNLSLQNTTTTLTGASTVKDMATMFELVYADFTALSADTEAWKATVQKVTVALQQQDKDPQDVFKRELLKTQFNGNALLSAPVLADVEKASYPAMVRMAADLTANAADYTFIILGNVDSEAVKPLIEKYIASLPSKGQSTVPANLPEFRMATGKVNNVFKQPMRTPYTLVYEMRDGDMPYSIERAQMVGMAGSVLSYRFTETLREEEGGSYSPQAVSILKPLDSQWILLGVYQTNEEKAPRLRQRAEELTNNLLSAGAKEEEFVKAKEATVKQIENQLRQNGSWMNWLVNYALGVNTFTNQLEIANSITLEKFNALLKDLSKSTNRLDVVMEGVQAD